MCGRFYVPEEDIDDFVGLLNTAEKELLKKAGEIFPGDYAPVITPTPNMTMTSNTFVSILQGQQEPQNNEEQPFNAPPGAPINAVHAVKWGFPVKKGRPIINARCETIQQKPMFKLPFSTHRCLIPARGFFEWKETENKKKVKYYISLKDNDFMYLAGIYWFFKNSSGVTFPCFTVITTEANEEIRELHDRMPVIIPDHYKNVWLYGNNNIDELMQLMGPLKPGILSIKAA